MDFEFKQLTEKDLPRIREMEKELSENEPDNHYCTDSDTLWTNSMLNNNGFAIGAFFNNQLVAFSGNFILSKWDEEENDIIFKDRFIDIYKSFGYYLNPENTVFFNTTLVQKDFRGNKLQKTLREKTIQHYSDLGNYSFVSSTAIHNKASATNLKKIGMVKVGKDIPPYASVERFFFYMTTLSLKLDKSSTLVSEFECWDLFNQIKEEYNVNTPEELIQKAEDQLINVEDSIISKMLIISKTTHRGNHEL